ncbi:cytochrome-c peroxidase [Leptospira barantonii]|uniref:Cytochrome c domain-containing protein n=1 Tax=Leptospira barantonii TaxID=2023184 RepID=A0ABX4NPV3_9LEPT|nr:cytochrome c peroxidase [Leptospira barantonii]PJZ58865.1 hypothetical protein CH367_02150 [Leptospira barantonii]
MIRSERKYIPFLCWILFALVSCAPKSGSSSDVLFSFLLLDRKTVDDRLRSLLDANGVKPLAPLETVSPSMLKLGEALFFDKILSGNKNISCATCHGPALVAGDTLVLSIGEGGNGSGQNRSLGAGNFIHRNSIELHNRGAASWKNFFWDGRIEINENGSFVSSETALPFGLKNLLSAQAMFPVLSRTEMRGQNGSNGIANLPDSNSQAIWDALVARLTAVPAYVILFQNAYPSVNTVDLKFQHCANAISDFTAHLWNTTDSKNWSLSPWNRYLDGDDSALNDKAKDGAFLFYGKAGCADCHSGSLMTDQKFHNLAVPQFGPGFGTSAPLDLGRSGVTGNVSQEFAFRTPPLREVSYTSPYFHNGAYVSLKDAVVHHLKPSASLLNYDVNRIPFSLRSTYVSDVATQNRILQTLDPLLKRNLSLTEKEIDQILEFLNALSSPTTLTLGNRIPSTVPSGLPVAD